MNDRILILADDLTGALDSAVAFAGPGQRVVVACTPKAVAAALVADLDVLAVNTASREVDYATATALVSQVLSALDPSAFRIVMKKIDSRLKGHIAAEVQVVQNWARLARLVACPAIPAMGRHVRSGLLTGAGIEVPVPVAARCGTQALVPDVVLEADLDAVVADQTVPTLWIGARGLAFALARRRGIAALTGVNVPAPLMIANGSRDPLTLAQIARLGSGLPLLVAPDGRIADANTARLESGALVLSMTDGGGGLTGMQAADRFAATTCDLAKRLRPATLMLCGGESAYATLDRLGIDSLEVIAEVRPGLPLCRIESLWGPVGIVTKSGGFGALDLLVDILGSATRT